MANPFSIEPVNPLQAILAGQQGYETARKNRQQSEIDAARAQIASGGLNAGSLAALLGAGDPQAAAVGQILYHQAQAAHLKEMGGYKGREVAIEEEKAKEPKYMPSTDENSNPIVLELKQGQEPRAVRPKDVPAGHIGVPGPTTPSAAPPYQQSSLTPENSGSMVGRPGERILADASFNDRFAGAPEAPVQVAQAPQQPGVAQQPGGLGPPPKFPTGMNQPEARKAYSHEVGKLAAQRPQAEAHTTDAISNLDRLVNEARAIRNDPALGRITGAIGAAPSFPGSAASNVEARLETLKSQTAFGVLQAMRDNSKTGGALGQVSDKEGQLLQANLAALSQKQSTEAFQRSLDRMILYAEGAKQRLSIAFERTHGVPLASSGESSAPKMPAIGDVSRGYRFKGGDPGEESNWIRTK